MTDIPSELHTRPSLLASLRDAHDVEAWQTFVRTYAPLVYGHCRRRGVQDADAADVTQEVLTQVAQAMRTFAYQRERGRFRDWLGTVTRHTLARFLDRRRRTVQGVGGDEAASLLEQVPTVADPDWTDEFNAALLQAALERIRPQFEPLTWRAFEAVWQQDRPAPEVATELGLSVDKVYGARWRVLQRLREEILLLAEDCPLLASDC